MADREARQEEFLKWMAWPISNGLIGHCSYCGDERVAPFTRTTREVA